MNCDADKMNYGDHKEDSQKVDFNNDKMDCDAENMDSDDLKEDSQNGKMDSEDKMDYDNRKEDCDKVDSNMSQSQKEECKECKSERRVKTMEETTDILTMLKIEPLCFQQTH